MANIESLQPEPTPYSEIGVYATFLAVMPETTTISVRTAETLDPRTYYRSDGWAGYVAPEPYVAHRYVLTDSAVPARELLRKMNDALVESGSQADLDTTTEDLGAMPVTMAAGWVGEAAAINSLQQRTVVANHRRHGLMGLLENAFRRRR